MGVFVNIPRQQIRLIIIVMVFVSMFYLQGYFKYGEFQIIQTYLEKFEPNILYEKKPIYLYDGIVNPADLLHTIFKHQYTYHVLSISDNTLVKKNLSKFVIIYNDDEETDTYISLMHPRESSDLFQFDNSRRFSKKNFLILKNNELPPTLQRIDVKLKPKNAFFIPLEWYYQTHTSGLIEIHLFDTISSVSAFIR